MIFIQIHVPSDLKLQCDVFSSVYIKLHVVFCISNGDNGEIGCKNTYSKKHVVLHSFLDNVTTFSMHF